MSYALLLAATIQLTSNCGGKVLLKDVTPRVTIEKTVDGPLAAPVLAVMSGGKKSYVLLDDLMAGPGWESKGTFFSKTNHDTTAWQSVELRCPATSPWSVAAWPDYVVYKKGDEAVIAATVAALQKALASEKGFATPSLYDGEMMLLVGPNLYDAIRADTAGIKSPDIVAIDGATKKARPELRAKGEQELAILAAALRKYAGTAAPRIRAATYEEVLSHWKIISWDINEPFLVVDYGAHRFVLDCTESGALVMIDELP